MENETKQTSDKWLAVSVVVAAALIGGSVLYSGRLNPGKNSAALLPGQVAGNAQNKTALEIGDDVVLGDPSAPVTLIEFGDYQCPYCGKFFSETEPTIRDEYIQTGKVKMVYKDLAFLGPESVAAAEAAECAKDQGKYWLYHDELFKTEINDGKVNGNNEGNGNLNKTLFMNIASTLEMDTKTFESCIDSRKYKEEVEGDRAEAMAINDRMGTPTSFINGSLVDGAQPFSVFKNVIDTALQGQ